MKILFLSDFGAGIGLAHRLRKEGNDVKVFASTRYPIGSGLVDRVNSWRPHIARSDLVLADGAGWGRYEDVFRKMGRPTFGISQTADMLSLMRERAFDVLSRAGVDVPRQWHISGNDADDRESVLREWTDPGVVVRARETTVCKDPETFEYVVSETKGDVLVEDLIEGVEVRTTGWFNGRDWIRPFYHGLMDVMELDGDLGRVSDSRGGVVVSSEGDRISEKLLLPLTKFLCSISYRGPFTVTAFANDPQVIAIDAYAGLRYDESEAMCEGLMEPLGDLIFETAQGVKKEMELTKDPMAAISVNASSWSTPGAPLIGLRDENLKHIWLGSVYEDDEGWKRFAGGHMPVFKATAVGRDVREALKRAYRTVRGVRLLNKSYRTDVGVRASRGLSLLKQWGWLHA